MSSTIGCYIHIPFCVRKCAYCDFNSYSGYGEGLIQRYVRALRYEINRSERPGPNDIVDTIFFGGGTPTAIPPADEVSILAAAVRHLNVGPNAEITTEANPGTADIAGLDTLRAAGFTRISFGVQSFDDTLLASIDRIHSAQEAADAVRAARSAGFDNISIDLMFGLPRQTMAQWEDTLDQALALETDHLSMYALIVEDGTGFGRMQKKGALVLPEDDLTADMFTAAIARADASGYAQYEISNFAHPGKQCRHNLHYWRADDYLGYGAGAVGTRLGVRRTNALRPAQYARLVEADQKPVEAEEEIGVAQQRGEAMILGLRMTEEGVCVGGFTERFGASPGELWASEIERFTRLGLLDPQCQTTRLRLTSKGVFLASEVMQSFV